MTDTYAEDIPEELLQDEGVELDETSAEFVEDLVTRLLLFIQEFCDVTFFPYQLPIAYGIVESIVLGDGEEKTLIATRQCLDGDSVVFRRDGSACRLRNHEDAWSTGIKPIKRYRTFGGGDVTATDNHPFWTDRGWVLAGDLQIGDLVAVLDGWDIPNSGVHVESEIARFLGYMTTDGSMRPNQSYKFTNVSTRMLDEVAQITTDLGVPPKWYEKGKGFDLLFTTTRGQPNPVRDLINSFTWDHGFPTDVFTWDKESVREFVNRSWSGDGCINVRMSHNQPYAESFLACGNDEVYANYWRSLLLRHGVHSTIKRETMTKGTGVFHRLVVGSGSYNMLAFFDLVGREVFGKEPQSARALEIVNDHATSPYTTTNTSGKYKPAESGVDGERFRFSKLIEIEDAGEREVFDVRYPGKGWFVANGYKVHNSGKSEVIANIVAGLMVILPKLADVYPTWLGKFKKGFLCGIFAPVEDQADTVFGRVVSKLTSDHAMDFLLDPELNDKATSGGARGKGKVIHLKNSGSLCRMQSCNPKAKIESKTYHFIFVDEAQQADEQMITKSIKPMLAFNNGTIVLGGTAQREKSYFYKMIQYNKRRDVTRNRGHKQAHYEYDWRVAARYNLNYEKFIKKEKLRIGEDSDEFRMSYSNEWILEKGMFVSDDRLQSLYHPKMKIVQQWWDSPIVVGIDVARSNDSTVVTPVWVDWDYPDGFGFYEHRVLNWLEINNVEWEQQYFEIINFLRNYNVLRVGVDSQGVGGPIAERLQILMPDTEVVPVSSDAKTQNDRWTHLTQLIQRGQLIVPGDSRSRAKKVWKRFNQQMSDLEKINRGPYMLAAAPDERNAFDDYPDSLAIACALTIDDTLPTVQVYENPFFG